MALRSYIGWVDLADSDIRRAKTVIAAFKQEDTVDPLGFQRLAEPFAERFYPATSTQMTRARYFIFVPAIYTLLARMKKGANALREESERLQTELMYALRKNEREPRSGVIGRRSEDELERFPSDIYWASLGKLKIFTRPLSERRHRYALARGQHEELVTDDQTTSRDEQGPQESWASVPLESVLSGTGIKKKVNFALTHQEANFLIRCWRTRADDQGESLMSERLAGHGRDDADYLWEWSARDEVLKKWQPQAKAFSAAARCLSLIYEMLVAEEQKADKEVTDGIRDSFVVWCKQGPEIVRRWDAAQFWRLPGVEEKDDGHPQTFSLLIEKCASVSDPRRLLTNGALRESVRQREASNRPKKCRLCGRDEHRKYLRQWERPDVSEERETFELDFRHGIGQRILRDLLRTDARAS